MKFVAEYDEDGCVQLMDVEGKFPRIPLQHGDILDIVVHCERCGQSYEAHGFHALCETPELRMIGARFRLAITHKHGAETLE